MKIVLYWLFFIGLMINHWPPQRDLIQIQNCYHLIRLHVPSCLWSLRCPHLRNLKVRFIRGPLKGRSIPRRNSYRVFRGWHLLGEIQPVCPT